MSEEVKKPGPRRSRLQRALDVVERLGNRLPDPAMLFVIGLVAVWIASALLSRVAFAAIDPRTNQPIAIKNLLTGPELARFLSEMVSTFVNFPPLGIVLVALLGVGVAEHTGFINAALKGALSLTPRAVLTPMLIVVACVSHTATDAGYVLVIPLGGIIFYAAGRHPLAGIGAAFAGVSGGFAANFVPSGIDPLLQGFTQSAAQILDPAREVNPLCNWYFTSLSVVLIAGVGWYVTDRIIEPRLQASPVELAEGDVIPEMSAALSPGERRGLRVGFATMVVATVLLVLAAWPQGSPLRAPTGELTVLAAPIMRSIVPLIFLFFLFPGIAYGLAAGTVKSSRDVVAGMSKAMGTMAYYVVMAFFAALFIHAFGDSNLGALIAIEGGNFLKSLAMPPQVTIVGIILLTAGINLLVGSASAKWALLSPIFVPMLMQLGLSPELTQAAYRVGDSTTNVITPLLPYFPLIVVFCQRWVRSTGIGTVVAMMLPYTVSFITTWTLLLLVYWGAGLPLGLQAPYVYP